jgi:suppressor of ftsI/bilirubin oxidase
MRSRSHRPPAPSSHVAGRRRTLAKLGALGLALLPRPGTLAPVAANVGADLCATAGEVKRPLFVPGERGYLGRLPLRGSPLRLTAARLARATDGVAATPLGYDASSRGVGYVNPTLVVRRGERMRIQLDNRLEQPTIVHWHGLAVDTRNDGAGAMLIEPGERYDYAFDVRERAGLYWYHPHPHGATAGQVYDGLYGLIEVGDDEDDALRRALALVPGRSELTLILQDRRTGGPYTASGADAMHGYLGDDLYVNGSHCAFHDVATRVYRLRVLNACNARTLSLAFRSAGGARLPFHLIGTDGGLLASAVRCEQVFCATAERIDLLLDLRDAQVGDTVVMETLAFDPMHGEMAAAQGGSIVTASPSPEAVDHAAMHHEGGASKDTDEHTHAESGEAPDHAHARSWPDGAARAILELRVRERTAYDRAIPPRLSRPAPIDDPIARERPLRLGFNKGRWRINDRVFAMGETPIEVARDSTEVWLLRNYHTSMPHAMHLHGFHFDVRERETSPDFVAALAVDAQGRLASDLGRKDTVLVWPGESVRIAIRFAMPFKGAQTYVFHCHNLEHEDGGMMLGVKVA